MPRVAYRLLMAGACSLPLLALAGPVEAAPPQAVVPMSREAEDFFEKEVRPMLVKNCISCHGADVQEAGLRLDTRDGIIKGVEGQPMAVPGAPERSRIVSVTRYDGDVQMPPDGKLPEQQLAALTKWVQMGLPWPDHPGMHAKPEGKPATPSASGSDMEARYRDARSKHWAFQPVRRAQLPAVSDEAWCQTPVDRFILAELEKRNLKPSPAADRRTLLRRLNYDLIGLPPTPAEVDAFIADKSPDAVTKVVDRLLSSPHYGERWARHWLDIARYADTKGYVFTDDQRYPYAYTYRDYVVRAFNEDLPYDRFLVEQLAADQLSLGEDNRALAAMGFLTVGRRFSNNKFDIIDDRIDVVTRGLQGMTVACARCHDHKYDAIPTDDYYSLYGVLGSYVEPDELPLIGKPADTPEYRKYLDELHKLEADTAKYRVEARGELEKRLRDNVGNYLIQNVIDRGEKGTPANTLADKLFGAGPQRALAGRWNNYLRETSRQPGSVFTAWHKLAHLPPAELAKQAKKLADAPDPKGKPPLNRMVREALKRQPPKNVAELARVYGALLADVEHRWLDQVAAATKPAKDAKPGKDGKPTKDVKPTKPPEKLADAAAEELRLVLFGPGSPAVLRDDEIESVLDQGMRAKLRRFESKVTQLAANSAAAPPRAMVVLEPPQPMNPRVLVRGNPGRPGKEVPRQFLKVVAGDARKPFEHGSGRLELAQSITRADNPLTARVFVNRLWMHHFGEGLVRTPSDFGIRCEPPSHPELLDWLAATFVEEGWSVKKLHRLIVLSSVYQQSSVDRPEASAVDPENRFLWRMNRQRLEFEAVRDSLLAVSGYLDPKIGGRPMGLNGPPWSNRRTLYALIDRQDLPNLFRAFDFPSPDVTAESRPRTTVPQQALYAMNAPFVLDQAKRLAARTSAAGNGSPARVKALYRYALEREPTPDELQLAVAFVSKKFEVPPHVAPVKGKPAPPDPLSNWDMLAQVLLLTNEFFFVD